MNPPAAIGIITCPMFSKVPENKITINAPTNAINAEMKLKNRALNFENPA